MRVGPPTLRRPNNCQPWTREGQLLATRILLFLLTIAASLQAAAAATAPYREVVGNGVNNNTDVTAAGACGFTIIAGSFVPGVCRDRSSAPCAQGPTDPFYTTLLERLNRCRVEQRPPREPGVLLDRLAKVRAAG